MSGSLLFQNRTNVRTSISAPLRGSRSAAVRAAIHALAPVSADLAARVATEVFVRPRRFPTPSREKAALASARFSRVPFGGGFLPTWTWGDDDLPAVLLVHGWEGRAGQLASFVEPLRKAGFRVVTFDGPGHGRSALTRSSAVHMALAVERMAHAMGPFAGLIAHSVGGAATALALHMSRGALELGRVVLLAPPVSAKRFFDAFCKELALEGAIRATVAARIEREIGIGIDDVDVRACTPHLHTPMLLLHDTADREVPFEDARTFVSAWPGAQLVATSGLGHRAILRDLDVVDAAAAFITGKEDVATGLPFGSLERDLYDRSRRWQRSA